MTTDRQAELRIAPSVFAATGAFLTPFFGLILLTTLGAIGYIAEPLNTFIGSTRLFLIAPWLAACFVGWGLARSLRRLTLTTGIFVVLSGALGLAVGAFVAFHVVCRIAPSNCF